MSWSDATEREILQHWLGISADDGPVAVYIGLYTNVPDDDTPGQLIVDAGLKHVDFNMVGQVAENVTNLTFGPANTDWGPVQAFGIFDAVTSPNEILWGILDDPADDVAISDTFTIAPGDITVSVD
jgi:hypothetical protein